MTDRQSAADLIARVILACQTGTSQPDARPFDWHADAARMICDACHIGTWRTFRLAELLDNWPQPDPQPTDNGDQTSLF